MTIWIFGDSFAYNEPAKYVKDHDRWYFMLERERDEKIYNLAMSGTGPYFAFDEFYRHYETDQIKRNDKIVFILSSPYRFPLISMPEDMRNRNMSNLHAIKEGYSSTQQENEMKRYEYDAMIIFETFKRELDYLNLKNICFLKTLSEMNDWKTIIFIVFGLNPNINDITYPEEKYDFSIMNSKNFKYYPIPLQKLSNEQFQSGSECFGLINHFLEPNHKIMFNLISNYFYNTNYDDNFKKNIVKTIIDDIDCYTEPKKFTEFIYD